MSHQANPDFWKHYHRLPIHIQKLADQNFALLKQDPRHPSLHLKKVGRHWSVRVGDHYRAVGVQSPHGILWYLIRTDAEVANVQSEEPGAGKPHAGICAGGAPKGAFLPR